MTDRYLARPPRRATMRDVAALAGVSLKTVSRVLNGESGVVAATSERVRRPPKSSTSSSTSAPAACAAATAGTATIGLILENVETPTPRPATGRSRTWRRQPGVYVLAGSLDEDPQRERELVAAFSSRRVDGLVMMPTGTDHSYLLPERRAGTPMVFVDRAPGLLDADVVVTDNRAARGPGSTT